MNTGAAAAFGTGGYVVYKGLDSSNVIRYIGITMRSPEIRWAEHQAADKVLNFTTIKGLENLSVSGARYAEQSLITFYGGPKGQLWNKINSIAPKNWWMFGL